MDTNKVIKHYIEDGMSTYAIAKKFSTYPNKIRRVLLSNGVELRDKSNAQKIALESGRAKHPSKGKRRNEEDRLKISKAMESHWKNMPDAERERRRNLSKENWAAMSETEKASLNQKAHNGLLRASREGSKAEKCLAKNLRDLGYEVTMHKKDLIEGNFEIDLFLPELKTIIEIDGPQHFMPLFGEKNLRNYVKGDSKKSGALMARGYCVIRIKYLCKHMSAAVARRLWDLVLPEINRIEKKFPAKGKRLIELEIS